MPSLRHNKKRNTGLLFEFLVREMSSCLLSGDIQRFQKCIGMVRKYAKDAANKDSVITKFADATGISA